MQYRKAKAGVHFSSFSTDGKISTLRKRTYKENHNFFSLHWKFFSVLELKKIQLHFGKNYSVVLSANEIAECNRLKSETNTVKHGCEKLK